MRSRERLAIGAAILAVFLAGCAGCAPSVVSTPATTSDASASSAGGAGLGGSGAGAGGGAGGHEDCDSLDEAPAPTELVYYNWVSSIVAHAGRLVIATPGSDAIASIAPDGSDFQVVVGADVPLELAVVDEQVHWLDLKTGLHTFSMTTGTTSSLFEPNSFATDLAADAANVYFVHAGTPTGVLRVPVVGGSPTVLIDVPSAKVATDGQHLFASDAYSGSATRLVRVPVNGGPIDTLYDPSAPSDDEVGGIALDDTHVYFTIGGTRHCCAEEPDCGCAHDCCELPSQTGRIVRVAKSGGPVDVLTRCVRVPTGLAVDGDDLFIIDVAGPDATGNPLVEQTRLLRLPKAGGRPTVLASQQLVGDAELSQFSATPGQVGVLAGYVYFLRKSAPYLLRVPR